MEEEAKVVDCTQAAMVVTTHGDVEKTQIEAVLPRLRHPDRIANHNILVVPISSFLAEEAVAHHFPRFSLLVSIAQSRGKKTPIAALPMRVVYASNPQRSSEHALVTIA
jgi:hypothetical protein